MQQGIKKMMLLRKVLLWMMLKLKMKKNKYYMKKRELMNLNSIPRHSRMQSMDSKLEGTSRIR